MIAQAISLFEPRLGTVQVSESAAGSSEARQFRFSIQAVLKLDPSPEQVSFDTVLDIATGGVCDKVNPVRDDFARVIRTRTDFPPSNGWSSSPGDVSEGCHPSAPGGADQVRGPARRDGCCKASAFLAARVHLKIDDDLPEISQSSAGVDLPPLRSPHSVGFDRRVSHRSGTGQTYYGIWHSARLAPLLAACGGTSV